MTVQELGGFRIMFWLAETYDDLSIRYFIHFDGKKVDEVDSDQAERCMIECKVNDHALICIN